MRSCSRRAGTASTRSPGSLVAALCLRSSWFAPPRVRAHLPGGVAAGHRPATRSRGALADDPDVVEVHDLHVWTVTSGFPALAAHVLVSPDADCHGARRRLQRLLTTLPSAPRDAPGRPCRAALPAGRDSIAPWRHRPHRQDGDRHRRLVRHRAGDGARAGGSRRPRRGRRPARRPARDRRRARARRHRSRRAASASSRAAVEQLGGLDILFNNAGLALGRAPFDESTEEDEDAVFNTNVNGLVRMTRLCLPHIRDGGHIVNMGSVAGPPGVRERRDATSRRSSPCAASRTRCAKTCSAGRSGSRPSTPASSRRSSRSSASRATPRRRTAVYKGVDPLSAGGHRRLRHVGAHAAVARERRRDRRQGAQPVVGRADPPRAMTRCLARRHRDADPAGRCSASTRALREAGHEPVALLTSATTTAATAASTSAACSVERARRSSTSSCRRARASIAPLLESVQPGPRRLHGLPVEDPGRRARGAAARLAQRPSVAPAAPSRPGAGRVGDPRRRARRSASRSTAWTRSSTPAPILAQRTHAARRATCEPDDVLRPRSARS